ncbi:SAM-dependent methyltransferase, partial [Shigella sonnei]|nr:SAM-dependent methyltransferase [Shigella sonnei]
MTDVEDKNWSRSEGDSWDIVSSVGYTALGVSAQRAV